VFAAGDGGPSFLPSLLPPSKSVILKKDLVVVRKEGPPSKSVILKNETLPQKASY
jgi:hypothetical protein